MFNKFFDWLNGETGTAEQQNMAQKTKYLFVAGDLVAGVGVYPTQRQDLVISDIYKQYEEVAKFLKRIPPHVKTIIIPGNHDAQRLAEPQPKIDERFAKPLWELPNTMFCASPSTVNIHSSETFSGFNVLQYHGWSYIYYANNVPSIRNSGLNMVERTDLVMKHLLIRRHLAPTHGSSLYIPRPKQRCNVHRCNTRHIHQRTPT